MEWMIPLAQLGVVLTAIVLGVRTGGVGLGMWGMVGLAVLVFGFHSAAGSPPADVIFIILTAVTAASVMEAAGGVGWMVSVAARLIKRQPKMVVFLAPLVAFVFTVGAGTGNVVYPLLPVIYDVCDAERIRPERALSMAAVASQVAIMCSPVSAATAAMVVLLEPLGFNLGKVLLVMWPVTLISLAVGGMVMLRWGKELDDDAEYQRRRAEGLIPEPGAQAVGALPATAFRSAMIFLAGVVVIVVLGLFSDLRPVIGVGDSVARLSMAATIQIVMGCSATLIFLTCRPRAIDVPRQSTFAAGMVAAIALFGLAWLADAFVQQNYTVIVSMLSRVVQVQPLMFAVALGLVAMLTTSQAAATASIVPVGLAVGLDPAAIVAMWASVGAALIMPTQGAQIAAVNFDLTGTTRIGAYVVDHSFQIPTLIYIVLGIAIAFPIAYAVQ
ncbi:MAG: hypothetical protein RLZZ598_241 [Pseudomonadota bacterium]|jgi:anaerobic C4-dicarboxylate transporter DcuA/anaerobic C4-dicarboxylate transporter DcuB